MFQLRVGTSNKKLTGTIQSGQKLTLMGNYQMPNSKDTCVALAYGDIIYDEYCYDPTIKPIVPTIDTTILYTDRIIRIVDINYDPE